MHKFRTYLKNEKRQKIIFKTVLSSLPQINSALAEDCLAFLPLSANTSTYLRKSCYFLRPLISVSPGRKISALIEYLMPHTILLVQSLDKEGKFILGFFPPSHSHLCPTLRSTCFAVYEPCPESLQAQSGRFGSASRLSRY